MRLDWWLALSPVLLIVLLMLVLRWGAHRAGPLGWLAAMGIGVGTFGAGPGLLLVAHAEALVLTLDVFLIVWAAILLYRVTDEAGAIEALGAALARLTDDRGMLALILAWPFASFLQGIGGFGVPVAVTAPILVGLGFSPLAVIVLPTIGHAWSATFGSLASSFQAMIAATGLPGGTLAGASATMLGLVGLGCGLGVGHVLEGRKGTLRRLPVIIVIGSVMGGVQYVMATHSLWALAAFAAGLAGMAVGVLMATWRGGGRRSPAADFDRRRLILSGSGYLVVILVVLIAEAAAPVAQALNRVVISIPFPATQTAGGFATPGGSVRDLSVFGHIGVVLGYATLCAHLLYRGFGLYSPGATSHILRQTASLALPVSLGILSMIAMAQVMRLSGMIDRLAVGLAAAAGPTFPLASGWLGALGAFVTGSNTNSNVVLGMLQRRTAELLGIVPSALLAAQNGGGAIGSVVSPAKLLVSASTVGMAGREGEVLRAAAPVIRFLLAWVSLIAWILVHLRWG